MPKKRVLIVDDETGILLALKGILESPCVHVDTAAEAGEAFTLMEGAAYDVVITDLRLTMVLREEGLEILRRAKERSPATRVIVITGHGGPELVKKAGALGADLFFEKPLSSLVLKNTLTCWGVA